MTSNTPTRAGLRNSIEMAVVNASEPFGEREIVTKEAIVSANVNKIGPATIPPGRVWPSSNLARATSSLHGALVDLQ